MHSGRIIEGVPHILGRYQLLNRKLGSGNYATVVEAIHLDLEVHVAIKIIDTSKVRDQYVLRHLAREAAVLRRLANPNIIAVFESMRAGPLYCLVTELVEGDELSAYVSRQHDGHLDEPETIKFAGQLVSALAHMHERGIVHRDLKMRNILLNRTHNVVKIIDFGLSNVWSAECPLRTHCGSPGYAAPEIYELGKSYGPEVDMWSLGVVLFGMAVGRLPFPTCKDKAISQHERHKRMMAQISRGATESHLRAMDHFSALFRDVVSRLLVTAPSQRLTIKEATLHPWLKSRPASSRLYRLSARESGFIFSQLSIMFNMPVGVIEGQCLENRLGEVGAAYNILAYQQLSTYHVAWIGRTPADPKSTSKCGQAFQGKKDIYRDRSISDVLQSGLDSYQYKERVSTSQGSLKGSLKKRTSRLTVEPISTTIVAPSWTTNSPEIGLFDEHSKRSNLPEIGLFDEHSKRSNLRRSPSPCFSKPLDKDALSPRGRRILLKTPKCVSFSMLSAQESLPGNEHPSEMNKRRPVASVATNTNEKVHRSVQTASDEDIISTCPSLQNIQKNVGHITNNKSTEGVRDGNESISRNENKDIKPDSLSTQALMQSFTKKTKSYFSSKINGTFLTTGKRSKVSTDGNKHTLKQSTPNKSSRKGTPCCSAQNDVDCLQTPKLITESSQSKSLIKSACPSRLCACLTEIKGNKSNPTNHNNKPKECPGGRKSNKKNTITRFMMDVALQKSLERISPIPPMPWAYHKRGTTMKTKSKISCQLHKGQKEKQTGH